MNASSPSCNVSVVVVSHNEGENLVQTVHSLLSSLPENGEIVVVDDGSSDGSAAPLVGYAGVRVLRPAHRLGAAAARNYGAAAADGDVLVFSDAHMQVKWGWGDALLAALARPEVGAVSPAVGNMQQPDAIGYGYCWCSAALDLRWLPQVADVPYAAPLLPGCFLAMRRDVFTQSGGFDAGLTEWGMEDSELSLRLWLLGYECLIEPRIQVRHLFRRAHGYAVSWKVVLHNMLRLALVHFCEQRLRRTVASLTDNAAFPDALARIAVGDTWQRRAELQSVRRYDDNWFFDRFDMSQI